MADDSSPFIVTTPATQSLEGKRNLIRSHVMRGKNRKKLLPRPPSWINNGQICNLVDMDRVNCQPIPPKVGNEFSFASFSTEISPHMLEAIWQLKHAMMPSQFGLASHQTESSFFEPILNDAACLHFTLFTTRVYIDSVREKTQISKTALSHLVTSLAILRKRLACGDTAQVISDTTILVVVGLTITATALGDLETAVQHIKGLQKIVTLRGGISVFEGNKTLQTKIFRADIGVALNTERQPIFFCKEIPWDAYIPSRIARSTSAIHDPGTEATDSQTIVFDLAQFLDGIDIRLRRVWDDIFEFSRAANIALQCKLSVDPELYQEVMVSIHYRLINLGFDMGSINETIRLTLLAFASTLFLQWGNVYNRYELLVRKLTKSLCGLQHHVADLPTQLMLWIYIVSAVSVFDEHEQALLQPALTEVLCGMGLKSWNQVNLSLKSIIWVDSLHDQRAKKVVQASLRELGIFHG
ncbi:hypothetical protein B0J13DRAFT_622758 [Dactylonectria estremocensis]|uniref:Uncharacterized protein n=1 Tax=Dactylonectria estremocensis TaxID=1079267 RepID=A0A9P9J512_9HYPO|nr:hypothetical protein B0J13DRAFT_622758 [Dactylonectria estremocensis]